jgi:hypothetical protein
MFELIVNNSYTIFAEEINAEACVGVDAGSAIYVPETEEHYLLLAPGELVLVTEEEEVETPSIEEPENEPEVEDDSTEEPTNDPNNSEE